MESYVYFFMGVGKGSSIFELTDFIHAQLIADEEEDHNNACITHSSSNVRCYLPKKII